MGTKTCIYTGKEAKSKDSVIPKKYLNDEEMHNWANKSPVNCDYKAKKQDKLPTELEMQANEIFRLLELAKLRVIYYNAQLSEIQQKITENTEKTSKKHRKNPKTSKKEKEVRMAIHEKKLVEGDTTEDIIKDRKKKTKLWG